MNSEPLFEVKYFDPEKNQVAELKGIDVERQLEKMKKAIEHMLEKMKKIGEYELSEFTAHAGGKLGILVFEANGFIEMKWEKLKK